MYYWAWPPFLMYFISIPVKLYYSSFTCPLQILEFMLLATSLVESIKMCVCKINRSIMCGWGEVQQKGSNLYDLGWRTDHRCPDPYPDQLSTHVYIWKWVNWKALFQLQSQKDVAWNIHDQKSIFKNSLKISTELIDKVQIVIMHVWLMIFWSENQKHINV